MTSTSSSPSSPSSSAAALRSTRHDALHEEAERTAAIAGLVDIASWCVRVPATLGALALVFASIATTQPHLLVFAAACAGAALIAYAPVVVVNERVAELRRRLEGGA